ncbi:MAG TPA: sodium:proton antiporter, partial [Gammaproteobacteria bacterium]
ETFYGNPASQHADLHMDLSGIGNLLALSPQRDANVISAIHFRADFGTGHIFNLATASELTKTEKHMVMETYKGDRLFDEKITYSKLASYISKGYEIHSTTLSENYIWEQYLAERGDSVIPLFAIDNKKRVKPFVAGKPLKPGNSWIIISLCSPE